VASVILFLGRKIAIAAADLEPAQTTRFVVGASFMLVQRQIRSSIPRDNEGLQ
jgi:hypothetical protein